MSKKLIGRKRLRPHIHPVHHLMAGLSVPMPDLSIERIREDNLSPEQVGELSRDHARRICRAMSGYSDTVTERLGDKVVIGCSEKDFGDGPIYDLNGKEIPRDQIEFNADDYGTVEVDTKI